MVGESNNNFSWSLKICNDCCWIRAGESEFHSLGKNEFLSLGPNLASALARDILYNQVHSKLINTRKIYLLLNKNEVTLPCSNTALGYRLAPVFYLAFYRSEHHKF